MNKKVIKLSEIKNILSNEESCSKKQLTEVFALFQGVSNKEANIAVDNFLESIETVLKYSNNHSLSIREWFSLEIKHINQERKYRNPKTGQIITKNNYFKINFKAKKILKNLLEDLK